MENDSRIGRLLDRVTEFLNEQAWFQQLKEKWEELDPQSRTYLKFASLGLSVFGIIALGVSYVWSVHQLKREVAEKAEILHMVQSANDELTRLRESSSAITAAGSASSEPWPNYLSTLAEGAGITKESLVVSDEKKVTSASSAGAGTEALKESIFEVSLKKVNIRQIVRLAVAIEGGSRPAKLRQLTIDTQQDPTGYMQASLSISAFSAAAPK